MDRNKFTALMWLAYHQACLPREGDARHLRRGTVHYQPILRRWAALRGAVRNKSGQQLYDTLYSTGRSPGVRRMLALCTLMEARLLERILGRLTLLQRMRLLAELSGPGPGPGMVQRMISGDPSAVAEGNHYTAHVLEKVAGRDAAGEFIRLLALRHCLLGASRN